MSTEDEYYTRTKDQQGNLKIIIHSDRGYTASCDAISSLLGQRTAAMSNTTRLLYLEEQEAHIKAQRAWLTRPQPDPKRLEELCRYLIAYETVPWSELKNAFPELYALQAKLTYGSTDDQPSTYHLRTMVIPLIKEALGLNPEESVV